MNSELKPVLTKGAAYGHLVRIAVFALVIWSCLYRLGSTPLLETDEGFAANRAASFYRHHTWRLSFDDFDDDKPQFRKPPLLYWVVASLYPALGWNTWSVRLPGALASIGLCCMIYRINRRHFDEATALASLVLLISPPFVLGHMRTAMLEMPLLALIFLSIYALAYLPDRRGSALLAGLAAGGSILIKGSAGAIAIVIAVIHSLILARFSAAAWRRAGFAAIIMALVFGVYYLTVPAEWRATMLRSMFVQEGLRRTTDLTLGRRYQAVLEPMWVAARLLLVLAVPGLLIAVAKTKRSAATREWLCLMILVSVPVIVVGAKQVVAYPRYFLPVYPFLATLAALFILTAVRRRAVAFAFVLAVAWLTYLLPSGNNRYPPAWMRPYPGMQELAERIPALVPDGEKVLMSARHVTCHQLLFYGRRSIISYKKWLADDLKPGATRYAVVRPRDVKPVPLVEKTVIAAAGQFQLLRLRVSESRPEVVGVLLCRGDDREAMKSKLRGEGRAFEEFKYGLMLLASP